MLRISVDSTSYIITYATDVRNGSILETIIAQLKTKLPDFSLPTKPIDNPLFISVLFDFVCYSLIEIVFLGINNQITTFNLLFVSLFHCFVTQGLLSENCEIKKCH